ncbi:hypothetical protein ASF08_04795 [Methylobacterium sp. Leaf85]|nr:hypothetical protein ASF08_04795 [Methylobacterium sp. Leaf85]
MADVGRTVWLLRGKIAIHQARTDRIGMTSRGEWHQSRKEDLQHERIERDHRRDHAPAARR